MKLPTLYSKDSNGAIRSWNVSLELYAEFYAKTTYGLIGGTMQVATKVCLVGERTAVNALEAQKFCLAMWNKQKRKGYTENKNGEPEGIAPYPMLAKLFENEKHKLEYPVLVQPKLDGFRCIAIKKEGKVSCWSRKGLRFETTGGLEAELNLQMKEGEVYDGELYRHNKQFDELSGEIRNTTKNSSSAQYHIYDCIDSSMPQAVRSARIKDLQETALIQIVPTILALSEQTVYELTDQYIAQGYEGGIVRNVFGKYRTNYRSGQLLKVKNFVEEDFKIIDFYEGEGKDEGAVIWECITPEGEPFAARPKGTYEERRKLFAEGSNHLGKYLTVRYPKNKGSKSERGVPKHAVGVRIREEME